MGVTIADINARGGRIEGIEHHAGMQTIRAMVPLSEVLSSSAHGRPDYPISFARYEFAPPGGWRGGDEAGVTANKPRGPGAGSGSASVRMDPSND